MNVCLPWPRAWPTRSLVMGGVAGGGTSASRLPGNLASVAAPDGTVETVFVRVWLVAIFIFVGKTDWEDLAADVGKEDLATDLAAGEVSSNAAPSPAPYFLGHRGVNLLKSGRV